MAAQPTRALRAVAHRDLGAAGVAVPPLVASVEDAEQALGSAAASSVQTTVRCRSCR